MEYRAPEAENQLLEEAIHQFAATTRVDIRVVAREYRTGAGRVADALAQVETETGTETYVVEVKTHLTPTKVALAAEQLDGMPHKGLLIADYVNPRMADRLKEIELAFIDTVGNAYLNQPPIYVYIKGNRPKKNQLRWAAPRANPAFRPTGLKMLFGLLTNEDLLNTTYREIAGETDVALGTVGWVLRDLRDHGYLYEDKDGRRRFVRRRQIIERWVAAYPDKLRPKLQLGRYRAPTHHWWQDAVIDEREAQWGGEVAAAKLTDYLKPETTVIYADAIPPRLLAANQLRVDPEGDVEILRRFWTPKRATNERLIPDVPDDVVPPLLIYADLMATADDRNTETAKIVYERYIDRHFVED